LKIIFPSGAYPLSKQDGVGSLPELRRHISIKFQMQIKRKTMQVLVQVYLPSFMFVIVSWISYLVKPEVVPGRMALLVTLFLVLVRIHQF